MASKPASAARVRFGLTAKVITLMLIVSLVPLGIFAVITLKQTDYRIQNDTAKLMALTASDIVANVDEWTDKNVRVPKSSCQDAGY
jgi:cell division protein FtsL